MNSPAIIECRGDLTDFPTRIPVERLPGNKIASSWMDIDITRRGHVYVLEQFMESIAQAFALQLHIPRDQVDIATLQGPEVPFWAARFKVVAHLTDSRVKTEADALVHYRNLTPPPPAPEFIDI
jgi:hypothetical protein